MPKEWDAEKLIEAVKQVSPPTTSQEINKIEGLLLAICTKLKNRTPVPAKYATEYKNNWAYVQLDLWRYT